MKRFIAWIAVAGFSIATVSFAYTLACALRASAAESISVSPTQHVPGLDHLQATSQQCDPGATWCVTGGTETVAAGFGCTAEHPCYTDEFARRAQAWCDAWHPYNRAHEDPDPAPLKAPLPRGILVILTCVTVTGVAMRRLRP